MELILIFCGKFIFKNKQALESPMNRMTDRCLWKHYLPLRSVITHQYRYKSFGNVLRKILLFCNNRLFLGQWVPLRASEDRLLVWLCENEKLQQQYTFFMNISIVMYYINFSFMSDASHAQSQFLSLWSNALNCVMLMVAHCDRIQIVISWSFVNHQMIKMFLCSNMNAEWLLKKE